MDKNLANLILDHGEELFPYLKLRSYYTLNGPFSKETALGMVTDQAFGLLVDSGYIAVGDLVDLRDGNRWLCDPLPVAQRATNQPNFDKQLDRLAELAGYPIDYSQNRGKYRKLYRSLYDEYGFDQIETIAYDNRGIGLASLLTKRVFKSLLAKFEAESR